MENLHPYDIKTSLAWSFESHGYDNGAPEMSNVMNSSCTIAKQLWYKVSTEYISAKSINIFLRPGHPLRQINEIHV